MSNILVMHGVNLNMFGMRDPLHYGTETLEDINRKLSALANELKVHVDFFQSNCEGAFVERIQQAIRTVRMHWSSMPGPGLTTVMQSWTHWPFCVFQS